MSLKKLIYNLLLTSFFHYKYISLFFFIKAFVKFILFSYICITFEGNNNRKSLFLEKTERWVSGLNHQFAKLTCWKRYRGFESRPHRT